MATSHPSGDCPVCHELIPLEHVNEHIDQCLRNESSGGELDLPSTAGGDKLGRKRQSQLVLRGGGETLSKPAKIRKVESTASNSVTLYSR